MAQGFDTSKDIVLKGVGKMVVRGLTTGRVVVFDKGQDMEINHKTDSEKLYGGDSLAPIYDYPKQSDTTISLTHATLKPSQLGITMASDVDNAGVKAREIALLTSKEKAVAPATLTGVKVIYAIDPDGKNLEIADADGSVGTDKVYVSADGNITFGSDLKTKDGVFTVVYEYDTTGMVTKVLADALPEMCEITITFYPSDLGSNKKVMNFVIPQARCDGNLNIDTKRDNASTPKITFNAFKKDDEKYVMYVTLSEPPKAKA